ncbi:uncharacterized protein NPIL_257451 [Nephila pilipes]|uniref:Uncharacterized protein n=1 Tax=Nephila pilipes TaxID=299642 RepID=A0A8X6TK12_NEPPI|nr:uncharacterized protein NPIL_257451 [Nephila pilipes]
MFRPLIRPFVQSTRWFYALDKKSLDSSISVQTTGGLFTSGPAEEHLLESPYKTNCTDYEELWKKNNKTGPRSQEMCKEWCLLNYHKSCEDCEEKLTMVEKPIKPCSYIGVCRKDVNLNNILNECRRNCKLSCKGDIRVRIFIRSPEVIVMSHKPSYTAMDIFSYVGGLMGCWLGISVWAFTDIAETTAQTVLDFLKQYVKRFHHSPTTRDQLFFKRNPHDTLVSKYSNKSIRVEKKQRKRNPEIWLK